MARFGPVDGKRDTIESGAIRRREQIEPGALSRRQPGAIGPRRRRAAQHRDRPLQRVSKADGFAAAGGGAPYRRENRRRCGHRAAARNAMSPGRPCLAVAAHDPHRRQPGVGKGDDLRILRIAADQRPDPRRDRCRLCDRAGRRCGRRPCKDRPCRYCRDHEEHIATPHRRSGAGSPPLMSSASGRPQGRP